MWMLVSVPGTILVTGSTEAIAAEGDTVVKWYHLTAKYVGA